MQHCCYHINEEIFGLEVAINDVHLVHVVQCRGDLSTTPTDRTQSDRYSQIGHLGGVVHCALHAEAAFVLQMKKKLPT